jgi:hypothetical protein
VTPVQDLVVLPNGCVFDRLCVSGGEFALRGRRREEMEVNKVNAEDANDVRPLESQHSSLLRYFYQNHSNYNETNQTTS